MFVGTVLANLVIQDAPLKERDAPGNFIKYLSSRYGDEKINVSRTGIIIIIIASDYCLQETSIYKRGVCWFKASFARTNINLRFVRRNGTGSTFSNAQ